MSDETTAPIQCCSVCYRKLQQAEKERDQLRAENWRLREALEWYSGPRRPALASETTTTEDFSEVQPTVKESLTVQEQWKEPSKCPHGKLPRLCADCAPGDVKKLIRESLGVDFDEGTIR